VHFAVIGRIQLKYEAGLWNEWHILFDDQMSGWLSDAGGEYLISALLPSPGGLPEFAALQPDQRITLAGRDFAISNIEAALCIAGEGELPFAFGAGYEAPVADLRATDESGLFATLDYSEKPPLLFIGESVSFASLRLSNLRSASDAQSSATNASQGTKAAKEVRALSCPACGGAISLHDPAVQSVACPSCLAVLDASDRNLAVLQKVAAAQRIAPRLPLGSVGRFEGKEWTVIGFQQRECTPVGLYPSWREFLLHHPTEGFRWLVEADGHWSWVTPVTKPPRYGSGNPSTTLGGETFIRYSEGIAVTTYVIGEFTWKVKVGEEWQTVDFVAPPRMLSREGSKKEVTWSLGEYRTPEEITTAFGLKTPLPEPKGVGAIQPNLRIAPHRQATRYFAIFLLVLVLAQAAWLLMAGGSLHEETLILDPGNENAVNSQNFVLDKPARSLALYQETNLDNNWIGLNLALVEQRSGQIWQGAAEISYWHGYDDGSWSEGSTSHEFAFRDLPAGEYYVMIDPEFSEENRAPVSDRIRVVRDPVPWSNFFFACAGLLSLWLVSLYRKASFETARWSEADFTAAGTESSAGSDDDDGDDD
jgi:hypothetical protein